MSKSLCFFRVILKVRKNSDYTFTKILEYAYNSNFSSEMSKSLFAIGVWLQGLPDFRVGYIIPPAVIICHSFIDRTLDETVDRLTL